MAKKIDPASIKLAPSLRQQVKPFAAALQSDDAVLSNLRETALTIGGNVLDATARMTPDERKAHIERFIADVCVEAGYAQSSIADRSSMMRAMIYSAGHRDNIIKLVDYAMKSFDCYQRARLIERTARHVKSRLNEPSEITLAALKRWIDADAAKRNTAKRKAKRRANAGPLAKLADALAFLCDSDADYSESIAAGYITRDMLSAAEKLAKEITPQRLKLDREYTA